MGVGYSVSALHRVQALDISAMSNQSDQAAQNPLHELFRSQIFGHAKILKGPAKYKKPTKKAIADWKSSIVRKYPDLLQAFQWDEQSEFEESEDVAITDDMLLRYLAAVIEHSGRVAGANLYGAPKPPTHIIVETFKKSNTLKSKIFPQILSGVEYWFTIGNNIVIEEPNWNHVTCMFGCVKCLDVELNNITSFITDIRKEKVSTFTHLIVDTNDIFSCAERAIVTISRMVQVAIAHHLPLWTTG